MTQLSSGRIILLIRTVVFLQTVAYAQIRERQYPTVGARLRRTLTRGKRERSDGCEQWNHKINNDIFDELMIDCIDKGKTNEDVFAIERTRGSKSMKKVASKGSKQGKAKKSRKSTYKSLQNLQHKPTRHPVRRPLPNESDLSSTPGLRPTTLLSPAPTDSSTIKHSLAPSSNPSGQSPSAEPKDVPQLETGQPLSVIEPPTSIITPDLQQPVTQSLQRSNSPNSEADSQPSILPNLQPIVKESAQPELQNSPLSGSQPETQQKIQPTSHPTSSAPSTSNNEMQRPTSTTRSPGEPKENDGENVFRQSTVSQSLSPSTSTTNRAPSETPVVMPAQLSILSSLAPIGSPSSGLATNLPVAPSDSPVGSPTRVATVSSLVPTSSPSTDASSSPVLGVMASEFPTAASTTSPLTLISIQSIPPTTWQLLSESVSPTLQSALSPSFSPSESQDNTSTTLPCLPKSNGNFGENSGVAQEISFLYEIEVFPNVVLDVVKYQILARVENWTSRTLIPALFTGRCANSRRLSEGAQGIGVSPADEVLVDVMCIGTRLSNANKCFVVNGKITLYFDTVGNIASIVATTKATLHSAMVGGEFNMLDQRVASVTYRNDNAIQNDVGTTTSNASNGRKSEIPRSGWVLIGCGFFVLATLLCVYFRCKGSKSKRSRGSGYVPEANNSVKVDPYIRARSTKNYSPNTEVNPSMSVMMNNNNVDVPVSQSIHRVPSLESRYKHTQQMNIELDSASVQDRSLQEQNLFSEVSSIASSTLQASYSSQKKPAVQRATFPGAVFSMGTPPPAKPVETEELLIASNNYADMYKSSASVGYLSSVHEYGDYDDEYSESDTYSESPSEDLSQASFQYDLVYYHNGNPNLDDNEHRYHYDGGSDVSYEDPPAR